MPKSTTRDTQEGAEQRRQRREGERDGRPITVTKAEFNHPKHAEAAVQSAVDEGNIKNFMTSKAPWARLKTPKGLTLL